MVLFKALDATDNTRYTVCGRGMVCGTAPRSERSEVNVDLSGVAVVANPSKTVIRRGSRQKPPPPTKVMRLRSF